MKIVVFPGIFNGLTLNSVTNRTLLLEGGSEVHLK